VSPPFFRDAFPNTDSDAIGRIGAGGVFLIVALGVAVRLFASLYTDIVNPDGIFYIHQAKAIFFGEWDGLTNCQLSFVSIYPFLISGAYLLLQDWIMAAQFVSLLFGSATLIPLYLLCRRFLDRDSSIVTLLLFSLLPVFVSSSAAVIRDPVCWFFLALGLYLFASSFEHKGRMWLPFSCLCFMVASWARIESALFLMVSLGYLLVVPQSGRIAKALSFALPMLGAMTFLLSAATCLDQPLHHVLRLNDILDKASGPFVSYQTLRGGLSELMREPLDGVMPHFLHRSRQLVWLVALGTAVKYMIRAYFYLFFVLFILGLGAMGRRSREDRGLLYLSVVALSVFVVFYLHVIQTWMMFDRFWGIFMIPAVVVVGFGLQKAVSLLTTRCQWKKPVAFTLLALLIMVFTLPKDLKSDEADKGVYRDIGELIARWEGIEKEIRIAKSPQTPEWTPFCANLNQKGAPCPKIGSEPGTGPGRFEERMFRDYDSLIGYLKDVRADYFLWEERAWPKDAVPLLDEEETEDLLEVGSWHQSDVGRIVLFRVQP